MIPKETLINTITSFDKLRTEKNAYLKTLSESKDTWSLEEFQKWQKMEDAWKELELVIEQKLLPFVENVDTSLVEPLQVETMKVIDAQIVDSNKRERKTGGTYITFLSKDTIAKETFVDIVFENKKYHFEVKNVEITENNLLKIEAKQVGYWATMLTRNNGDSIFDIRTLLKLPITIVTDEREIKQIHIESCWC
jgi:hypothetical protein